jgi:hypothetical protein
MLIDARPRLSALFRSVSRSFLITGLALGAVGTLSSTALAATEDAELVSLVSPLPPANSNGGSSVSISNGTAVVGAPSQNSAYIFTYDGGTNTWTYQTTITGGTTGDQFGASVSISGNNIAIGAPGTSGNAGAVYIYNGSVATWTLTDTLTEPGAVAGDQFGYATGMDGLRLVIGAPFRNFPGKAAVGTAYLFSSNGTNWTLNTNINLPPGQRHAGSHIGATVALSGAQLLVGAPDDSKGSHTLSGNVYDFVCNGVNCVRAQRLAPAPANNAHFGSSLAIQNNIAFVGARGNGAVVGKVFVFTLAGTTWTNTQSFSGSDTVAGDLFGSSVAIGGKQAVVGASGAANGGKSYLFGNTAGTYSELFQLLGSNTAAGDAFGTSVTLSSGEAVIGAPFATNPTATNVQDGGAYAYKTAKDSQTQITDIEPTTSVTGETYTVSVLVTNASGDANIPTGTVAIADDIDSTAVCTATLDGTGAGSCQMASSSLGQSTHNIEATYSGDALFGDSSAQQSYEVDKADTTTAITLQDFNPSVVGQTITFTASVTPNSPGAGTPTGQVTITDASLNAICTIADISLGQTCTFAFPAVGTVGLIATYAGDENFNGSSDSSASHETDQASTTTSVAASPEPSVVGEQVTFTVTVTPQFGGAPTGSATVSDTSNNLLCTVPDLTVSQSCTYTFTAAGSTDVVARYSGDNNFLASDSSATTTTHVTNPADTTLSVTPDHNPSFTGGLVTFTVGVSVNSPGAGSPTGSVTITDTSLNPICTVADITVATTCQYAFSPAGVYNLIATYSGDSNFNTSNLSFSQTVSDPTTHLAFSSTIGNVEQGDRPAGFSVNVIDNVSGNPDASDNTTQITLTLNDQVCGSTLTFGPVTVVGGVADFTGLITRFYALHTGYMFTASSSTALPTTDSSTFDIVAGNVIFSNGFETCRP